MYLVPRINISISSTELGVILLSVVHYDRAKDDQKKAVRAFVLFRKDVFLQTKSNCPS